MTVYRLEGAVVPNLIHPHIVSRVLGLSPSSVMPSESQGFQDKSYSFVQKGIMHVTKGKKKSHFSKSTRERKSKTIDHGSPEVLTLQEKVTVHVLIHVSSKKTPKLRQTFGGFRLQIHSDCIQPLKK